MITAAALCPAAPLMAAELTGDDPDAAEVRAAALDAVSWLVASDVAVVAVVGVGPQTREWPASGRPNLAPYGGPALVGSPAVPLGVGLGGRLLDRAGFTGDRLVWTVAGSGGPALVLALAGAAGSGGPALVSAAAGPGGLALVSALAGAADRVGLLVLADGSAHRNLKSSNDVAERAATFDAAVEKSIVDGHLAALATLDPTDLMVTGFPALCLLATALPTVSSSTLRYCAAPFGVGYFVATLHI